MYVQYLNLVMTVVGSVWALAYDTERRVLFSGGFDSTIVVWDIGSQQGTSYELNGHRSVVLHVCVNYELYSILIIIFTDCSGKIKCLHYSANIHKLLSFGDDGFLWLWNLDQPREEV